MVLIVYHLARNNCTHRVKQRQRLLLIKDEKSTYHYVRAITSSFGKCQELSIDIPYFISQGNSKHIVVVYIRNLSPSCDNFCLMTIPYHIFAKSIRMHAYGPSRRIVLRMQAFYVTQQCGYKKVKPTQQQHPKKHWAYLWQLYLNRSPFKDR